MNEVFHEADRKNEGALRQLDAGRLWLLGALSLALSVENVLDAMCDRDRRHHVGPRKA